MELQNATQAGVCVPQKMPPGRYGFISSIEVAPASNGLPPERVYFIGTYGCVWSAHITQLTDSKHAGLIIPPCTGNGDAQCIPRLHASPADALPATIQAHAHPTDPSVLLAREPARGKFTEPSSLVVYMQNGTEYLRLSCNTSLKGNNTLVHARSREFAWIASALENSTSFSLIVSGYSSEDNFKYRPALDKPDNGADLFLFQWQETYRKFSVSLLPCSHSFTLAQAPPVPPPTKAWVQHDLHTAMSPALMLAKIEQRCAERCGFAVGNVQDAEDCRPNTSTNVIDLHQAHVHHDGTFENMFNTTCIDITSDSSEEYMVIEDAVAATSEGSMIAVHSKDQHRSEWTLQRVQPSGRYTRVLSRLYVEESSLGITSPSSEGLTVPAVSLTRVASSDGVLIATVKSGRKYESLISYDEGAHWQKLGLWLENRAWLTFSEGTRHVRWDKSVPPVHSSVHAPGVLLANGWNISSEKKPAWNQGLFLSSDYGRTFVHVSNIAANFAYDVSGNGSIVAFAPHRELGVRNISFSLDGGHSVQSVPLPERGVSFKVVDNIVAGPGHSGSLFYVHMRNYITGGDVHVEEVDVLKSSEDQKACCDYAYDIGRLDFGCIFGRRMSAHVRREGSKCVLCQSNHVFMELGNRCTCSTAHDFECSYGYHKNESTSLCVPVNHLLSERQCPHLDVPEEEDDGEVSLPSGMQRAPGNECVLKESKFASPPPPLNDSMEGDNSNSPPANSGNHKPTQRRGTKIATGMAILVIMLSVSVCIAAVIFLWQPLLDLLPDEMATSLHHFGDSMQALLRTSRRGFRAPPSAETPDLGSFEPLARDDVQ